MPLPLSGAISFNNINVELGVAGTTQASLGQASYRALAAVPSGAISMSNFYGKSNRVTINLTISSNTQNYNIFSNKGGTYVAGKADVVLTINSGIVVSSSSTGGFSLDTGTGWTSGDTINIVNNGTVVGAGGNGGNSNPSGVTASGTNGGAGGVALKLQYATSIQNNNIIGGGGGGGAGGSGNGFAQGGGGGGGGGSIVGNAGTGFNNGIAGTGTNGGNGGDPRYFANRKGLGGSAGNNGTAGVGSGGHNYGGGGGGGLGGSGGGGSPVVSGVPAPASGGGAGAATSGSGTYATWLATGTRYGTIG